MPIPLTAQIPTFEVLLAAITNWQSAFRKWYIECTRHPLWMDSAIMHLTLFLWRRDSCWWCWWWYSCHVCRSCRVGHHHVGHDPHGWWHHTYWWWRRGSAAIIGCIAGCLWWWRSAWSSSCRWLGLSISSESRWELVTAVSKVGVHIVVLFWLLWQRRSIE
jgi:hypothetical protein